MTDNNEESTEEFPVNTLNEFAVHTGQNLPNHTASMVGKGKFIRIGEFPKWGQFRTQQEVYRLCAYLLTMAELLPHEPGEHTYEEVEQAIHNS